MLTFRLLLGKVFEHNPEKFSDVTVDVGGYGIVWNDELDLSCDELREHGETIETAFDGLLAFSDATALWGLNESTLRKAISYGKLINGVDVCKFGKQYKFRGNIKNVKGKKLKGFVALCFHCLYLFKKSSILNPHTDVMEAANTHLANSPNNTETRVK